MAVCSGVSMTGKMLIGRDDMVLRQSPGKGLPQRSHPLRIIRKGPGPDHGIGGVIVYVDDRREIHVEALGRHLLADDEPRGLGVVLRIVPGRTDGHISGHTGPGAKTGDDTALLIHRHEIGNRSRNALDLPVVFLQVGDQLRRRWKVLRGKG